MLDTMATLQKIDVLACASVTLIADIDDVLVINQGAEHDGYQLPAPLCIVIAPISVVTTLDKPHPAADEI